MTNGRADAHKMLDGETLSSRFGILTKAISIASSSLQQIQSISRFVIAISAFRSSLQELFCKKGVLKNFAKFTGVSSGTGVSCEFCEILKETFFRKTPTVAAFRICTIRDLLF